MSTELSRHPLHVSHTQSSNEQQDETSQDQAAQLTPYEQNNEEVHDSTRITKNNDDSIQQYTNNDTESEDILTTINKLQDETRSFFAKWLEELSPSEEFEVLCPSRVDQLLKEAYSLEQSMEEHKNIIGTKLSALSDVLKLANK